MSHAYRRQLGWSLVELSVALVIAALLGVLVFTLLPLGNRVVEGERQLHELAQAEQALLGYARAHGRLPAADSDGDGEANDGALGPWLPVSDLGLPSRMRIRYQVQTGLASAPGSLFHPLLPGDTQHTPVQNTLDFCMRLLLNQRDNITLGGLGTPVAYYLGHAGVAGHDLVAIKDGWVESGQHMPGRGDSERSAHAAVAAGSGELSVRLSCPERLARAQGSAQAAFAAHSALRLTEFNVEFRDFDIKIAQTAEALARTTRDLAAYALAESITNEAIAITLMASGWPPDGVTISAGIKQLVTSVKAMAEAIKSLVEAEKSLQEAIQGVADARERLVLVTAQRNRIQVLYDQSSSHAIRMDNAGLNP